MRRGRWVVAALVIALTGCDSGVPASGRSSDPPGDTRAPIIGPSGVPPPGASATAPDDDSPAPGSRDPAARPAPGAPAPRYRTTAQQACDSAGAGRALRLSTRDPAAARVLDQWDACLRTDTTPAYTWVHNRSRAVWTLRTTPWDIVQEHRPARTRLGTVQSAVFHRAAEERGKPGHASAFIHPGESLWIAADPGTVSWQVDLPLTVAWAGAGEIIRRLDDHGQRLLTEAVARRDEDPSATVTCVLALYDYARNKGGLPRAELEEVVHDGFEDMLDDDECAEAAGETIVGRSGRTISVLEDVLEVIPGSSSTMKRIGAALEPYREITGAITLEASEPADR